LYCVGIVLVLRLSAEHYHFPFAHHSSIILHSDYVCFECDIVLIDQFSVLNLTPL